MLTNFNFYQILSQFQYTIIKTVLLGELPLKEEFIYTLCQYGKGRIIYALWFVIWCWDFTILSNWFDNFINDKCNNILFDCRIIKIMLLGDSIIIYYHTISVLNYILKNNLHFLLEFDLIIQGDKVTKIVF